MILQELERILLLMTKTLKNQQERAFDDLSGVGLSSLVWEQTALLTQWPVSPDSSAWDKLCQLLPGCEIFMHTWRQYQRIHPRNVLFSLFLLQIQHTFISFSSRISISVFNTTNCDDKWRNNRQACHGKWSSHSAAQIFWLFLDGLGKKQGHTCIDLLLQSRSQQSTVLLCTERLLQESTNSTDAHVPLKLPHCTSVRVMHV